MLGRSYIAWPTEEERRLKKVAHAEEYSNSEISDDEFFEESMPHIKIKTVKRSAEESSAFSRR